MRKGLGDKVATQISRSCMSELSIYRKPEECEILQKGIRKQMRGTEHKRKSTLIKTSCCRTKTQSDIFPIEVWTSPDN